MAPLAPPRVPEAVRTILDRLWSAGHAAYALGGGVRDELLGRAAKDWDVASDARPERLLELFPAGHYGNRFGTVTVEQIEVTTFRRDHVYADHRRPSSVTFTSDVHEDLARRDFTVNAIAWGRQGGGDARSAGEEAHWLDPTGGLDDLAARRLRAVGDPATRFDEDALRLLRGARLAAQLNFDIEPATLAAMRQTAAAVRWISTERIGQEFRRMLEADPPSRAFRILDETGLLEVVLPELAAQRGLPQDKIPGHDLWQHSLATLDAAAQIDPDNQRLRLAALLHDVGKPPTYAEGRFIGHDSEGAHIVELLLARLAFPRREIDQVALLVRQHMFSYESRWSNAAVRRFIRRVGPELTDDLIKLRQADNLGSGKPAGADGSHELRRRIAAELEAGVPLSLRELAVGGDDLVAELGLAAGPLIGRLLDRLLESVIADPERNTRERLLADARAWAREETGGGGADGRRAADAETGPEDGGETGAGTGAAQTGTARKAVE